VIVPSTVVVPDSWNTVVAVPASVVS